MVNADGTVDEQIGHILDTGCWRVAPRKERHIFSNKKDLSDALYQFESIDRDLYTHIYAYLISAVRTANGTPDMPGIRTRAMNLMAEKYGPDRVALGKRYLPMIEQSVLHDVRQRKTPDSIIRLEPHTLLKTVLRARRPLQLWTDNERVYFVARDCSEEPFRSSPEAETYPEADEPASPTIGTRDVEYGSDDDIAVPPYELSDDEGFPGFAGSADALPRTETPSFFPGAQTGGAYANWLSCAGLLVATIVFTTLPSL